MPNPAFRDASTFMFARIAESEIASISPAPKTGVGMRKMMFGFPPCAERGFPAGRKLGWAMLQPAASLRPVMTKRSCTSPSLVPLGFRLKRASRTGPFCVMNQGTTFFAPWREAIAIKGFCAGLDPPAEGCEWQDRHWLELKRGPKPLFLPPVTTSISANLASPSLKNALSSAVKPCRGLPAPAAPPRTPGSVATFTDCADVSHDVAKTMATNLSNTFKTAFRRVVMPLPHLSQGNLHRVSFDSNKFFIPSAQDGARSQPDECGPPGKLSLAESPPMTPPLQSGLRFGMIARNRP